MLLRAWILHTYRIRKWRCNKKGILAPDLGVIEKNEQMPHHPGFLTPRTNEVANGPEDIMQGQGSCWGTGGETGIVWPYLNAQGLMGGSDEDWEQNRTLKIAQQQWLGSNLLSSPRLPVHPRTCVWLELRQLEKCFSLSKTQMEFGYHVAALEDRAFETRLSLFHLEQE